MTLYLVILIIGFVLAMGLMPFASLVSNHLGAVSETGGRHIGSTPIGRLGGAAVLIAVLFSILIGFLFDPTLQRAVGEHQVKVIGIIIGTLFVGGVGFWDDVDRVAASKKMVVHLLGAAVAYSCGVLIPGVEIPIYGRLEFGLFSFPVTILWIVGIVNAFNLIDGLDGLAGGVILFAAVVNCVSAISCNAIIPGVVMAAVIGSVLGFLRYNWYPARIYLGDGGAYCLGFLVATCSLFSSVHKASTGIALLVPILGAGLPIIDTLVTLVRRTIRGHSIFSPDRGHFHHVLLDSGINHKVVVVGLYLFSWLLSSVAIALVLSKSLWSGGILIVSAVIGLIIWGKVVVGKLSVVQKKISEWFRLKE
jgi:UDP-GlcNAc:undecaprenyl-phosphate GlcNAc-1-phosphate transferase